MCSLLMEPENGGVINNPAPPCLNISSAVALESSSVRLYLPFIFPQALFQALPVTYSALVPVAGQESHSKDVTPELLPYEEALCLPSAG